jgi:GTPase Era involved in 16S rRNA processing
VLIAQDWKEHPEDLSPHIPVWLESALKIVEASGVQDVAGELETLNARQKMPGFRLAFVGDFSRGKSTLVNRLLGLSVLPVRSIPTTATVTTLLANAEQEERMEVCFPSTHVEYRPLKETSWRDLLVRERVDQTRTDMSQVRLALNHEWLRQLDIEFIDTPGLDDLKSPRAGLISEVLSQCDAAILVVSAALPFSMTESAFLTNELLGRHVPRVTVVVSKLDILAEDQRAEQFKNVQDRVARVAPLIPVLPASPIDTGENEAGALATLRSYIEMLADKADRRSWRSRQMAATIADYLGQFKNIARATIAATQLDETKREEALRQARSEVRGADLQWERIHLELDQRCFKIESQLQLQLHTEQENLLVAVSSELTRAPDPPWWWRRDFPVLLRQAFFGLEQKFHSFLNDTLASDAKWLQEELTRTFDVHLIADSPTDAAPISITLERREITFDDVNRKRLLIRILSASAAIAGVLLLSSTGQGFQVNQVVEVLNFSGSFSQGVSSQVDPFFGKAVEKQRQKILQEAQSGIERSIAEYASRMSMHLRELYQQIALDMQRERNHWQSARSAAIEAGGSFADTTGLQQLMSEASALQATILAQLEK